MQNVHGPHVHPLMCMAWTWHLRESRYEFCRKMRSSWPAGMHTMWFCCLANPQTWDRADLGALLGGADSDPLKDSPFARALQQAKVHARLCIPNSFEQTTQ